MVSTTDISKPPPQTADFPQIWPFLEAGIHKLMDFPEKISPTEYMNLTVAVYNLAMRSKACALDLQKNLMETFKTRVELIANRAATKLVDVELLRYYVEEYQGYKAGVERVNRVFAFYNRWWAKEVDLRWIEERRIEEERRKMEEETWGKWGTWGTRTSTKERMEKKKRKAEVRRAAEEIEKRRRMEEEKKMETVEEEKKIEEERMDVWWKIEEEMIEEVRRVVEVEIGVRRIAEATKKIEQGSLSAILPVDSLALTQWREKFTMAIQTDRERLTSAILQLIMKERADEQIKERHASRLDLIT